MRGMRKDAEDVSKRERKESELKDDKKRRAEGTSLESGPMSWSLVMFAKGFESSSGCVGILILGESRSKVRRREPSIEQD